MVQLEALEPEHAIAERSAQPVGGTGSDAAEPDDDRVPVPAPVGHAPRPPRRARRSASRSTATTVITSLIRPSRVIASTSSNGSQRTARSSVPSGVATPWVRPVATNRTASSSETLLERWTRASSRQSVGGHPGLLDAARAGRPRARVSPVGHAALRDLPRVLVERVAVLPDEQDPVLVVEDQDAGREVGEVDDAVDARARRPAG